MKKTAIASVLITGIALAATASTFAANNGQSNFGFGFGGQNQGQAQNGMAPGMDQGGQEMGPGMGGPGGPNIQLTDDEKKSLESMSDSDRKAFMDKKIQEACAKHDAEEAVIDKLLNGETLSDADKALIPTIKQERADRKAKEAEMKSKHDAIKAAMDKQANGETLTSDEQALISSMPQGGLQGQNGNAQKGNNKGKQNRRGGGFGRGMRNGNGPANQGQPQNSNGAITQQ